MKKSKKQFSSIEILEPRLLFSADAFAGVMDSQLSDDHLSVALEQQLALKNDDQVKPTWHDESQQEQTDNDVLSPVLDPYDEGQNNKIEVVFVDTATPDYQILLDDLLASNNTDRQFDIVLIDHDTNGVQLITDTLSNYQNLDAVHIISHGDDGSLELGNFSLDAESLNHNSASFVRWADAFSENGDILFYGCNLAETAVGKSLVNDLSELTQTDVAASIDLTGHKSVGGDWDLEYSSGSIEADVAVSDAVQSNWKHSLLTQEFQEGVNGYTGTQDTYLDDANVNTNFGSAIELNVDQNAAHTLIRFDDLFGSGPGQIPPGSTINSATLEINVTDGTSGSASVEVFQMQTSWSESSTWTSMVNGIQTDGVEASVIADASVGDPGQKDSVSITGLETSLQAWSDGDNNYGWVIKNDNTNLWALSSSEDLSSGFRPKLIVDYTPPSNDVILESYDPGFADLSDTAYEIKTGQSWGQSFAYDSPGTTYEVNQVDIVLSKAADAPAGQIITVSIRDSWDGAIIGSASISSDSLTTSEAWYSFNLGAITLNDNTNYVIQIESSGTEKVYLGADVSGTYSNGDLLNKDGVPQSGIDAAFRVIDIGEDVIANNDTAATDQDTAVNIDVTANDVIEALTPTVLEINAASNGTVVSNGDGTVTYTPDIGYVGVDTFEYTQVNTADTTSYWQFDGDAVDASGTNDGTVVGATTVDGQNGNALSFDALDDHVVVSDFDVNSEFSLSFQIKIDDNTGSLFQYVYSHGDINDPNSLNIFLNEATHGTDPNMFRTVIRDADDTLDNTALEFDASSIIGDGQWHTYTLTVESGVGAKVYLDGVLQNSDTRGGDSFDPTTDVYMGARQDLDANRLFGGSLDSVQIFDKTLSASEVSSLVTGANQAVVNVLVVDEPSNNLPVSQAVNEDETLTFSAGNGNAVVVSGAGPGSNQLQVQLSVNNGTLNLSQTTGLTIVEGANGSASMTIHGSESDINSALEGMTYNATASYNGSDTLEVTTSTDADLVGYYSFDTGTAADDSAGTSQIGTLTNNATIVTDGIRGEVLSLDGDRDYVTIPSTFDNPANVTLSAWVNYSSADINGGDVISLGNDVVIRVDDATQGVTAFFWDGTTHQYIGSNISLADGNWHHIAFSFDDATNTQTLYIDGVVAGSSNNTDSITYTGWFPQTVIGSHANPADVDFDFSGLIDDARIYDRALSTEEILALATDNSSVTGSVAITVNPVNDAPVLDNSSFMALDTITEDEISNGGNLVSEIIASGGGDLITDVDSGALEGIAIVGLTSSNGTWEYNTGSGWTSVGAVSSNSALLLGADDSLRFIPDGLDADLAFVTFSAWDQTSGTAGSKVDATTFGGSTAFSSVVETASITVTAVNDSPAITSNGGTATAAVNVAENTTAVTTVTASDVDLDTLTYSLDPASDDDGFFTINSSSGALTFTAPPDFETPADLNGDNVYEVIVKVDDGNGGIDTQAISVTVTDILNTLNVDTTTDNNDSGIIEGNLSHDIEWLYANLGADSAISLREAIIASNNTTGTDTIQFSISAPLVGGAHTIDLLSALPVITDAVIIDGTTDSDFATTPIIELDGSSAGAGAGGIEITSGGSTIRGLVINQFGQDGILLNGGSGNTIVGNYIGTDVTGTVDLGNDDYGVESLDSSGNTIGGNSAADRNLISGNTQSGISLWGSGASNNIIQGNYIGTNAAGTALIGNDNDGISIGGGASSNTVGGDRTSGEGNVISGNEDGIELGGTGTDDNSFYGNYIGTNFDGTSALGNDRHGVVIYNGSQGTEVGGTGTGEGNIISGNPEYGIVIDGNNGTTTTGNLIRGNIIGLNVSGSAALANGLGGIHIFGGAQGNTIGGDSGAGEGNVISGNTGNAGIYIEDDTSDGNIIQGNLIGTNAAGSSAVQNNHGIWNEDADGTIIGGDSAAGLGNVISGNTIHGVYMYGTSTGVTVQGNLIGTNTDGDTAIGNGFDGIRIEGGASGNTIGGDATANLGNVIAGNTQVGVHINSGDNNLVQGNWIGTNAANDDLGNILQGIYFDFNSSGNEIGSTLAIHANVIAYNSVGIAFNNSAAGTGNAILRNSIYANDGMGIDIGDDGATANDISGTPPVPQHDSDAGPNNTQNYPVLIDATVAGGNTTITGQINSAPSTVYRIEFFSSPVGTEDSSGYGEGSVYLGFITVTTDANGYASINSVLPTTVANGDRVTATATVDLGGGSYGDSSEFAMNVIAVANVAPVITSNGGLASAAINVPEKTTAITTVTANDGNLDTLTYSLDPASDDDGFFTINSSTGVLTFTAPPDFETPADFNGDNIYEVTVIVDDGNGGIDTQAISVTVTDVNDVPIATGNTVTATEDIPLVIGAGDFSFSDAEGDSLASVTITGLNLNGGTLTHSAGAVTVTNGMTITAAELADLTFTSALNDSTNSSFTYTVNDAGLGVTSATMNITVNAANDLPVATGNTVIAAEDLPLVIGPGDFSFSDVEGDSLASVTITGLNLNGGTLTHSAGAVTVTNGMTITAAELADLTFTSALNDSTNSSFTYTVNDAGLGVTSATMNITVNSVNDVPVATGNTVVATEDVPLVIGAGDFNFSDIEGDSLTSVTITGLNLNGGTLTHSAGAVTVTNGMTISTAELADLTFTSALNDSTNSSFTYTVNDTGLGVTSATMNITVNAANDVPVATGNTVIATEDVPLVIGAGDFSFSDVEGDSLTSVTITGLNLNGGTLTHSAGAVTVTNGMTITAAELADLTFTSALNDSTDSSFTHTVNDAGLGVTSATMNITVNAVNDVPVATGNTVVATEDVPLVIGAGDFSFSDVEGDSLTSVTITGLNLNGGTLTHSAGAVTVTNGMTITAAELADLTFTSALNDSTNSSFTYTVNDAGLGVTSATMNITINAVNDVPVATGNTVVATEDVPLVIGPGDFSFSDVEGDGLTSVTITGLNINSGTLTHSAGAVTVTNGMTITAAELADLTFTSALNDSTNSSFTYTVNDAGLGVTSATMNITVNAANDVPVATGNTVIATEDLPLVIGPSDFSFSDVEGDSLASVTITGLNLNGGTLTHSAGAVTVTNGMTITAAELADLTFTSALNDSTNSSFTYTVNDAGLGVTSATMNITVNAANDVPVATGNTVIATEDVPLVIGAGDFSFSDTEGDSLTSVTITGLTLNGGTLTHSAGAVTVTNGMTISAAELADLTFTSALNDSTNSSFTYTVNDAGLGVTSATMNITVNAVNDVPVATGNTVVATEDVPLVIGAGDFSFSDVEGDSLASVTITGLNLNGGTLTHSAGAVTVTNGMTITAAELADLTFTSALNDSTNSSFTYTVNDAGLGVTSATMNITVNAANDVPVATGNTVIATEDVPLVIGAGDFSFSDVEGDSLASVTITGLNLNGGTLTHSAGAVTVTNGMTISTAELADLTFTSALNDSTNSSFTYTVNDAGLGVTSATMNITVNAANDVPVATGNTVIATEDVPLVLGPGDFSFSDVEGDSLASVTITGLNLIGGTLTHSAGAVTVTNGMTITAAELADLTFTSALNDSTDSSFTYTVNDAGLGVTSATMNITVNAANDAPVLDTTGAMTFTTITEDQIDNAGQTVASIIGSAGGDRVTDADGDPEGIAILAASSSVNGTFEYSINGGTDWIALGSVSTNNALLLRETDLVRFNPDGTQGGTAAFSFRAWDQSSGTAGDSQDVTIAGGSTAFSSSFEGVLINVTDVNDVPVAAADSYTVNEGSTTNLDLAANDSDVDDGLDLASITIVSGATNGSILVNANGTVDYTHDGSETLADSFTYTIDDVTGDTSNTVTVNLTVTPQNDVPVATGNTVFATEDVPLLIGASDFSFSDAEGDSLASVTITGLNLNGGTLTHSAGAVTVTNGMTITAAELADLTFTSALNDSTDSSFTYTVNDAGLGVTSATMNITVNAANDVPVATGNTVIATEDVPLLIGAGDFSFSDTEGNSLASVTITGLNLNGGTLTHSAGAVTVTNGMTITAAELADLTFTTALNDSTNSSFTYTVNDAGLGVTSATMNITVNADNDVPVATGNTVVAIEDVPLVIGASDFIFSDIEGDSLASVTITGLNLNGGTLSHSAGAVTVTNGMTITAAELADLTFTSALNDSTNSSFTYTVNDAGLGVTSATMNITVNAANDVPEATGNTVVATEDVPLVIGAGDFSFSDVEGDSLASVTITGLNLNGGTLTHSAGAVTVTNGMTITAAELADLTFTSALNDSTNSSFTYTVNDSGTGVSSGVMNITVNPTNDSPVAVANSFTVNEGSTSNLDLATNDSDVDDGLDLASITIVSGATHGSIVVNANGTVDYTHDGSETVTDSFTYTIDDTIGTTSNTVTVNLTITPQNDVPVATGNTVVATEDVPLVIGPGDFNFSDAEGDGLASVTIIGLNLNGGTLTHSAGAVTVTNGMTITAAELADLTFTSALNDSTDSSFTYTVNDAGLGVTSATMNITVNAANDVPVATGNTVIANEDVPLVIGPGDFSFSDTEGDSLTSVTITGLTLNGGTLTHSAGAVTVTNGMTITVAELADLTFASALNDSTNSSFTYTVNDAGLGVTSATMNITVNSVNDVPVATGNTVVATEDVSLVIGAGDFSFSDTEGDSLASVTITGLNLNGGTLTHSAGAVTVTNGMTITAAELADLTFTSALNDSTNSSFTYTVNDAGLGVTSATMNITVNAANDTPVAVADGFTVNEGSTTNLNLATNDSDVDDGLDLSSITIVSGASNGSIVVNANGTVDYTHDGSETITDSFTYTIDDATGATSNTVTVNLTITPQNDVPVATGNTVVATEDVPLVIGAGDFSFSDAEGDSLTSVTITDLNLNGGTLTHSAGTVTVTNGMTITTSELADLTFTSALNDSTNSSFTYTVNDSDSGVTPATINITVNAADDPPVIGGTDTGVVSEDLDPDNDSMLEVSGTLLITDADPGQSGFVANTITGSYGELTIDGSGNWSYSADNTQTVIQQLDELENLTDTIAVTTLDGSVHNIVISISGSEDAPVIISDGGAATANVSLDENQFTATTVVATDVDSSDTLTYSIVGGNDASLFSIDSDSGELTFINAPDFEAPDDTGNDGIYEVEVAASDGAGGNDTQLILVTTADVNENPSLITLSNSSINENTNTDSGYAVGILSTVDQDFIDTENYVIVGGTDAGLFSIGGTNSDELILTAGILDFESKPDYDVIVQVSDSAGNTHQERFTVTINNQYEQPLFNSTPPEIVNEDESYIYPVLTVGEDGIPVEITASSIPDWLTLNDNGDGTATLTGTPQFSDIGVHEIELLVTDGTSTSIQRFAITVTENDVIPETGEAFGEETLEADNTVGQPEIIPEPGVTMHVDEELTTETTDSNSGSMTNESVPLPTDKVTVVEELAPLTAIEMAEVAAVLNSERGDDNERSGKSGKSIPSKFIDLNELKLNTLHPETPNPIPYSSILSNAKFIEELNEMKNDMDNALTRDEERRRVISEMAIGVSVTLTAGFVSWVLKSGSLIAGFLSVVPVWKQFDPLPILASSKHNKRNEPEDVKDKVESLFNR